MEFMNFYTTWELANYMDNVRRLKKYVSFYTGYDRAVELLKDLSLFDGIDISMIDLEDEEIGGYSREYAVSILEDGELFINKCWHDDYDYEDGEGNTLHRAAGYYYDEPDVAIYDGEVSNNLTKAIATGVEFIAVFDDEDDADDSDSECDKCCDCCECESGKDDSNNEDDEITFGEIIENLAISCLMFGHAILDILDEE